MSTTLILLVTLVTYFFIITGISRHLSRKERREDEKGNENFFRAGRRSPWWMVGFGMIGASISGVSFISVPGWVSTTGMTYLQMCIGFFFGYLVVAFVLLPLYYRLQLTSIYDYLRLRFGPTSHTTGALFFILSKLTGAAVRLYLVCLILVRFLFPLVGTTDSVTGTMLFVLTVVGTLALIWCYTRRSGLLTIVRTDALQTFCLLLSAILIPIAAAKEMGMNVGDVIETIRASEMGRIWEWDFGSRQAFWQQFLSGVFIVIVMTGLDQDMMQKNLTCRTLREAQKNMCTYGACFVPVNLLLLGLGILLYTLCSVRGFPVPSSGDDLLPMLVADGQLGTWVIIPFTIGIVAAAFSSADSAVTSLTTSVCIDLIGIERRGLSPELQVAIRRRTHTGMFLAFLICILAFRALNGTNIINTVYVLASYTYGPLLGLFAFGYLTRLTPNERFTPLPAIAAPTICGLLDHFAPAWWGYTFGYELLLLNGLLTFGGLWLISGSIGRRDRTIGKDKGKPAPEC